MIVSVMVAALLMASSFWRMDADVTIQVQTGRIEFSVNPEKDHERLTDSLHVSQTVPCNMWATSVSLSPNQLLVANPDELDWEKDEYPPKAWVELP